MKIAFGVGQHVLLKVPIGFLRSFAIQWRITLKSPTHFCWHLLPHRALGDTGKMVDHVLQHPVPELPQF